MGSLRRWNVWGLLGTLWLLSLSSLTHSQGVASIGDVKLGELSGPQDIDYYRISTAAGAEQVSIALYGHVAKHDESVPHYLRSPLLILERRRISDADWIVVYSAAPSLPKTEIARIQNCRLDPAHEYRVGVSTANGIGGNYALVLDRSVPDYEFEIEDLDFGTDPSGRAHVASCAHVGVNPEGVDAARVIVGTEGGYILESVDDAQSWRQIYPPAGQQPFRSVVFGVFVDSQGIIYASPWTPESTVDAQGLHGCVLESRDAGASWTEAIWFEWPVGVGWRYAEDLNGNVFVGEYTANSTHANDPRWTGNVWRRKNHGNDDEIFEIVYRNPIVNPSTKLNHVHYVGVDPYTNDVYATIGDGSDGRFVRSRRGGEPGTWQTLERGVDAQYTSVAFTPDFLYLGQDTNHAYKKVVRWNKEKSFVSPDERFWTTTSMDGLAGAPAPWADKGNWFWGHYLEEAQALIFQYLPYGLDPMPGGQMQTPRLYASRNHGHTWWRAVTFPPVPNGDSARFGFYGPKHASNVGPQGWVYATHCP